MTKSSNSETRSRLLSRAFIETVRESYEFREFCSRIHGRDSVPVSVGSEVFILSRDGLVPTNLTIRDEAEWLCQVGRLG